MKRIYLFLFLFITAIGNASAQKDLELLQYVTDTVLYNAGTPKTYYIYAWGFRNTTSTPFTQNDTLFLRTNYVPGSTSYTGTQASPYFTYKLTLPPSGIAAMDTVYFLDTAGFTAAFNPNPFNWCDSIWFKTGATVQTEPNVNNNKKCTSVRFLQDPASVGDLTVGGNMMALYPNPANNQVTVKYNFAANSTGALVVRDLVGKVVYSQDLGKNIYGEKQYTLDLGHLSTGMYIVELTANDTKAVSKLTIQK